MMHQGLAASGNTVDGSLICVGLSVLLIVIFWSVFMGGKRRCELCQNPLKRTRYVWNFEKRKYVVCPECNRRLRSKKSQAAIDRLLS